MEEASGAPAVVICVAGMPRSGTSLVTQLLHRCGLYLGSPEDLMPASPNNTDGFWENLRFVRLNERLLTASGGTWFAPPATLRPTPEMTAEAKKIVAGFARREPWGWKDPRNAVTLPFWKSLLPSAKVLVCVRHPAETAMSLVSSTLVPRTFYWAATRRDSTIRLRDGATRLRDRVRGVARSFVSRAARRELVFEVGIELWRVSNARILEETSRANRMATHYEAVLANPRRELERILDFAGIAGSSETLDEAVRVVAPRLRHQRASNIALPPEIAALYAQLTREAGYAG